MYFKGSIYNVVSIAAFSIVRIENLLLYYAGFCLGGFGLGESMDERPALLTAITVRFIFFQLKLVISVLSVCNVCKIQKGHDS